MEREGSAAAQQVPAAATSDSSDSASTGKTDSKFSGAQIRDWFASLSGEDLASVLCIEDGEFLATWIELSASPSVHHGQPPATGSVAGRLLEEKKVDIEEIEEKYVLYRKQMAPPSASGSGGLESGVHESSSSSSMMDASKTTKPHVAVPPGGSSSSEVGLAGHKKKSTDVSSTSDAFRIPNGDSEKLGSLKTNDSPSNEDLLEHIRVVFPDACAILLERFGQDEGGSDDVHFDPQLPLLTFEPSFLESNTGRDVLATLDRLSRASCDNDVLLSEKHCSAIEGSSFDWIEALKRISKVRNENRVSLSLLLTLRIELSIMEAYVATNDKKAGPVDGKKEDAEEIATTKSFGQQKCAVQVVSRLCSAFKEFAEKEDVFSLNLLLSPAREVLELDAESDMLAEHLVFTPVTWLIRPVCGKGKSDTLSLFKLCGETFSKTLRFMIDGSSGVRVTQLDVVHDEETPVNATHETDGVDDKVESTAVAARKTKKKKKKKPKRKLLDGHENVQTKAHASEDASVSKVANATMDVQPKSASRNHLNKSREPDESSQKVTADVLLPKKEPGSKSAGLVVSGEDDNESDDDSAVANSVDKVDAAEDSSEAALPTNGADQKPSVDEKADGVRDKALNTIRPVTADDDHSAWETVESRGRASRTHKKQSVSKQPFGKASTGGQAAHLPGSPAPSVRKQTKRKDTKRRNANRKMAREILSSVLDGVDREIKLIRQKETMAMLEEQKRRHGEIVSKSQNGSAYAGASTMRDIVLGRRFEKADTVTPLRSPRPTPPAASEPTTSRVSTVYRSAAAGARASGVGQTAAPERRSVPEDAGKHKQTAPTTRGPTRGPSNADLSTAPTLPETVSGMSSNTHSSSKTPEGGVVTSSAVDAESSSNGADVAKIHRIPAYKEESKDLLSPPPPLQTLPWPGSTISASSSVASSLEAPHTSHQHHSSAPNVNEVGYHLLDVCARLSRDMDVFMQRRASALTVRRQERGALLAALQETSTKLWPGKCHVEMYGSCATQLDLPSSDVDAVICGLDQSLDASIASMPKQQAATKNQDHSAETQEEITPVTTRPTIDQFQSPFMSPYSPAVPLAPNAERVIRLAAELERQPWAVQVKAIPTATVPVVKILADPSRVPGAVSPVSSGGDWFMQQHMAAQAAAAAAGIGPPPPPPPLTESCVAQGPMYAPKQTAQYHGNTPPWRGSDVMNGLFSVDITFEGPEHGGIGSTAFSARVVQDAVNETGLPPDRTPVVQVLMVLKEILAQRRLNEPFSGGMSSYGLLLLVVAVLKERQAIREELERIERQRMVVAAESCCSTLADDSTTVRSNVQRKPIAMRPCDVKVPQSVLSADSVGAKAVIPDKSKERGGKADRSEPPAARTPPRASGKIGPSPMQSPASGASSWASIARKNSDLSAASRAAPPTKVEKPIPPQARPKAEPKPKEDEPTAPKVATFADIVNNNSTAQGSAPRKNQAAGAKAWAEPSNTPSSAKPTKPAQEKLSSSATDSDSGGNRKAGLKDVTPSTGSISESKEFFPRSGFGEPSLFPQGTNDVLEVLCSGEMTAGKLLMHFLLFYGQHFDSQATAIDVSGTHHPDYHRVGTGQAPPSLHLTPFVPRKPGGTIDPVTGMLTVDPIVVYDPLEGAENNNVARSCFAWNSIRWVFAQSYMTLASVVERSETPPTTPTVTNKNTDNKPDSTTCTATTSRQNIDAVVRVNSSKGRDDAAPGDMVSPLLEMLLSF